MKLRIFLVIPLAAIIVACGRNIVAPADNPATPAARTAAIPSTNGVSVAATATPGLTRLGFIEPWNFAPSIANVRVGQTFEAVNHGGETHTFTEVAEFGGGFVQFLNDLAHVPNVAPECRPEALEADDFVAPGGTYRETVDHAGHLKFQCCIHPWMRLEASSR